MTIPCFVIRSSIIGKFLPSPPSGRGGTWVIPTRNRPRIFWTKRAASTALTWWLKGQLTRTGVDFPISSEDVEDGKLLVASQRVVETRAEGGWEVVPFYLTNK